MQAGLYIVSTPIGNLKDITLRALETLKVSNYILCEDTRITKTLLQRYDIKAKLLVYNDHSDATQRHQILQSIQNGEVVSLVSDAGTPLVSDPGYKLVQYLRQHNCFIDVLPGASSVIAALCLSGLASDKFIFLGFAPKGSGDKATTLREIKNSQATTIFFETANRILQTLEIALEILGNRNCAIVREITKIHQEVLHGSLEELISKLKKHPLKGEIVLLIEKGHYEYEDAEIISKIDLLISEGISKSQATRIITKLLNLNKNQVYNLAKQRSI